jgi:hypothetical protein
MHFTLIFCFIGGADRSEHSRTDGESWYQQWNFGGRNGLPRQQNYSLEYPGDENAKWEICKRIFNVST